jgi:hypothetical protein
LWLEHRDLPRFKSELEPALEQGTAHFAGADQHHGAGEIA